MCEILEMTELSSELKNMLKETHKIRKAFLELKAENVGLTKLSEKQKQHLIKSKNRCKKLMQLFTEKYRYIMEINAGLKSEVNHLRQIVNDLQPETENQAIELKTKDDHIVKLEEELELLRAQIDMQTDEHTKNIETIQERNRIERTREVSHYQTKLDAANAEIERLKKRLDQQIEHQNKSRYSFNHPALNESESDNIKGKYSTKRKKQPNSKWPNLNVTISTNEDKRPKTPEQSPKTAEQSIRKKKLFLLDKDTIVDLQT